MEILQQSFTTVHVVRQERQSLVHRFFAWCRTQEEKRLLWLAVIVFVHGCIITPITAMFVLLGGNNIVWWPPLIGAMGMSLVTNLAAMPTKITIPVFFLSLVIDLAIIIACISHGLDISSTYI